MSTKLVLGLMSGTSADGIDAALVEFDSISELRVVKTGFTPYDATLRDEINQLAYQNQISDCDESPLHQDLAELYAKASLDLIAQANLSPSDVNAIANHGQTVRHEPNAEPPFSLQLGSAQRIADLTGVLTIGNFRQADLAAGGQGAPLMPAFHAAALGENNADNGESRYLLNIGGVANLTQLGDTVIGFDTGPGNTLLDQWVYKTQGKAYDKDGAWAASGAVQPELLSRMLADPYFSLPFPKSTGPDHFNLGWLGNVNEYRAEDVQATLLELTVQSIVGEMRQLGNVPGEVFVCGGGAHNNEMMSKLAQALPKHQVKITDQLGIPTDWVEAVGFAWLGYCRLCNVVSNLPSVTGASESLVLGDVFFPDEKAMAE